MKSGNGCESILYLIIKKLPSKTLVRQFEMQKLLDIHLNTCEILFSVPLIKFTQQLAGAFFRVFNQKEGQPFHCMMFKNGKTYFKNLALLAS